MSIPPNILNTELLAANTLLLKAFIVPGFSSRSFASKFMSEKLTPLSNSPVTNFPFNNNSTLKHFVLLVEHTLITLVCSVFLFQGQFRLVWVELPQFKQLRQFLPNEPFAQRVDIYHNCFYFWGCHFSRAYLVLGWEFLIGLLNGLLNLLTPMFRIHS